jgi:hypothetical protein
VKEKLCYIAFDVDTEKTALQSATALPRPQRITMALMIGEVSNETQHAVLRERIDGSLAQWHAALRMRSIAVA